jgi:hypothetical protein
LNTGIENPRIADLERDDTSITDFENPERPDEASSGTKFETVLEKDEISADIPIGRKERVTKRSPRFRTVPEVLAERKIAYDIPDGTEALMSGFPVYEPTRQKKGCENEGKEGDPGRTVTPIHIVNRKNPSQISCREEIPVFPPTSGVFDLFFASRLREILRRTDVLLPSKQFVESATIFLFRRFRISLGRLLRIRYGKYLPVRRRSLFRRNDSFGNS